MAVTYAGCEYCGALTQGRDEHGEPACAVGEGCALRRRRPTIRRDSLICALGETRTLADWIAIFAENAKTTFSARTILDNARRCARSLAAEVERRLRKKRARDAAAASASVSPEIARRYATELGITYEAFCGRVRRYGLERAVAMGPKRPGGRGRRPSRGVSVDQLAARVGLHRASLYKAARCAGHSIDVEYERRLARRAA